MMPKTAMDEKSDPWRVHALCVSMKDCYKNGGTVHTIVIAVAISTRDL